MVNGTPVLDIKPYVPQYDTPCVESRSIEHSNQLCDDNSVVGRNLHWERLPRESDGRSEDGDSILQDQSDLDFDIQGFFHTIKYLQKSLKIFIVI